MSEQIRFKDKVKVTHRDGGATVIAEGTVLEIPSDENCNMYLVLHYINGQAHTARLGGAVEITKINP